MIAYGGQDIVTTDGKLHSDDPKIKEAVVKTLTNLSNAYKEGYVPPGCVNWNDADDNNAFHSKLIVMDFDGTISTEVAIYHKKEEYDDIADPRPAAQQRRQAAAGPGRGIGPVIPKGAKNVEVAKEFVKY